MLTVLVVVFVACAAIILAFQVAVALGAPWGHLTQGGRQPGALSSQGRGIAVVSAFIITLFIISIISRVYDIGPFPRDWAVIGTWIAVGYCSLAVPIHIITPSAAERRLWLPIILAMLLSATTIALTAP
jgi:hypothetical protein